jgi:hypothetical protein
VPKRGTCSRVTAFGLYNKPKALLRESVRDLLAEVRHHRCNAELSATRRLPVKRLRNRLINAMSIHVACQPAQVEDVYTKTHRDGSKSQVKTVKVNPIWVLAPRGAFYKAKRVCSLVTDIVMYGGNSVIAHDIERLAINIWRMSKGHFDGLCRRIRSKLAKSVETDNFRKSPETVKRFEALITNPLKKAFKDEYRFSRNRICPHKKGYAAMRLSTKVENVTESHTCRKCTKARTG